jgi:D-3-phosphoglycerate dehydrogenase
MVQAERVREYGIEPVTLEQLFRESDFITLHIPGGDSTRGMVDEKLLSIMKPGATLVNCARHGVVDEEALREAKKVREIRFLNDVYPKDGPGLKEVADIADIMLPHLGASTYEANHAAAERAARQLIDLDEKGVTSFIVNRGIPEGLDQSFCNLAFMLGRVARSLSGHARPIRRLETSFYGILNPYAQWLLVSLLSGMCEDFDRYNDYKAAVEFLRERGIEYINRQVDGDKGYDNSITIDIVVEGAENLLQRTSVRGTVAESVIMVSRVNSFDHLYFVPDGVTLFFLYDDRPGVIASISRKLADAGYNIEDIRNPHDKQSNQSLAIFKVYREVTEELVKEIGTAIKAHIATSISL